MIYDKKQQSKNFGLLVKRYKFLHGLTNMDVARLVFHEERNANAVSDVINARYIKRGPDADTVQKFMEGLRIPKREIDQALGNLQQKYAHSPWIERYLDDEAKLKLISDMHSEIEFGISSVNFSQTGGERVLFERVAKDIPSFLPILKLHQNFGSLPDAASHGLLSNEKFHLNLSLQKLGRSIKVSVPPTLISSISLLKQVETLFGVVMDFNYQYLNGIEIIENLHSSKIDLAILAMGSSFSAIKKEHGLIPVLNMPHARQGIVTQSCSTELSSVDRIYGVAERVSSTGFFLDSFSPTHSRVHIEPNTIISKFKELEGNEGISTWFPLFHPIDGNLIIPNASIFHAGQSVFLFTSPEFVSKFDLLSLCSSIRDVWYTMPKRKENIYLAISRLLEDDELIRMLLRAGNY